MRMEYNPFANPTLLSKSVPIVDLYEVKIKKIIRDGVLSGKSESAIFIVITKLVNKCIKELPNDFPDLAKTKRELLSSAYKWYQTFIQQYMMLALLLFGSLKPIDEKRIPANLVDEYKKRLEARIFQLADMPIKDYSQMSSLSIWARSEIDIRREMHETEIKKLITKGDTLRRLSSHKDCSKRCEAWQGKLVDLEKPAIDSSMWTGDYYKREKVYSLPAITSQVDKYGYRNNIIVGFNCRHTLIKPNDNPNDYSVREIKKAREINARMRQYENRTKKPAMRCVLARNRDDAIKYYNEYLAKRNEAIKYAKANKLPVYTWRMELPAEVMRK